MKFNPLKLHVFLMVLAIGMLLGVSPAQAQARPASKNVRMQIDFISWGEDILGLEVKAGKSSIIAKALAFRYSESIDYEGPPILAVALGAHHKKAVRENRAQNKDWEQQLAKEDDTFASAAKQLDEFGSFPKEGEIPKDLAAVRKKDASISALIKLPAGAKRVTILLAPGPQGSFSTHILDDDLSGKSLGKVRVHNFSRREISLIHGNGKNEIIKPGKNFMAPPMGKFFAYELAYKIDGKFKIQENNMFAVKSNELIHMVVLRSGSSFFRSRDGSRGGFMQTALLRRMSKTE